MKDSRKQAIGLILLPLILMISCNNTSVFSDKTSLNGNWNRYDTLFFDVPITDTISPHRFYFNIRNNNEYNFSNLYIFLHTSLPGGGQTIDTLEFILANKQGKWLGKGMGSIKENDILIQQGLVFPQSGIYHFAIEQAMRKDDLSGIEDIGIRIEKE